MRRALAMVMALCLLASAALPVLAGGKPEWVANEPADPVSTALAGHGQTAAQRRAAGSPGAGRARNAAQSMRS